MRLSYRRSGVRLTLPRRKRRGFQMHVAMPSWPSPGPVNAVASYPARSTPADLTSRRQVATAAAETPAPGGTPRGTFAARAAASLALADTRPGKGDDRTLRLTSPRRQQIKQRQESNSLLVTSTTKKSVGLAAHGALTPYLKLGGCGAVLLNVSAQTPARLQRIICGWHTHRSGRHNARRCRH